MPDFDAVYLDLVVALAVAFFLLSLAPSALNEGVAFVTRIRAKFLWAYLNQIFTPRQAETVERGVERTAAEVSRAAVSPQAPMGDPVAMPLTGKPNALGLPSSGGEMRRLMVARGERDPRPTASSETTDAQPVVDRLLRELRPIDIGSSLPSKKGTTVKHVPAVSLAHAVIELLLSADPSASDPVGTQIERLRGMPVHATMASLWASSEANIATFREQLERWFDGEMARLSGLYKRLTRWILAIAAILVVVTVNVDPIALGRDLWRDPARRADFVAVASTMDNESRAEPELEALYDKCRAEGDTAEPTSVDDAAKKFEEVRVCVVDALEHQRQLGLLNDSVLDWDRFNGSWTGHDQWLFRPLKLALVAAAIFLGAPFWYDLIRRLVGVRKKLRSET